MLINKYGSLDLEQVIIPPDELSFFPKYGDREAWASLNAGTREIWLDKAKQYKAYPWPALKMDSYLQMKRTGNTYNAWSAFVERRAMLGIFFIAECMEGNGQYLDQIVNGIYAVCEETSWVSTYTMAIQKNFNLPNDEDHFVDLCSAETGSLLAWICFLMKDTLDGLSGEICLRIKKEVQKRIIRPYIEKDDYWWMGFTDARINNWNPWCNMCVIMCYTLFDFDAQERARGLHRVMQSLDRYIETYPADGGCDEGPMYWGAAGSGLNVCLELLQKASGGIINIFDEQKIKDIGSYIYKVHIHNDYYVDYADGDAKVEAGAGIYSYGKSIRDEKMVRLGASAKRMEPTIANWFHAYEYLNDLFTENERKSIGAKPPYIRDAWLDYTQILTAREQEGSEKGLFLSAKGGNNLESHNHNDIGNFVAYADGKPILIDLGTEEYTVKTFSAERFSIWYLQSQYHNCPTIRGVMQHDGKSYRAKDVSCEIDPSRAEMSMDISEAYPEAAGLCSWVRTCGLVRGEGACIEVTDTFVLSEETDDILYHFMSLPQPLVNDGRILLEYGGSKPAEMIYDAANLTAEIDEIQLTESRLVKNWGEKVYRIILKEKAAVTSGKRTVRLRL